MPVTLDGVRFDQIMPDNSGPPSAFDTDLDGEATQEDEFVSITNTNGTAIDISGWQIWSDSTGGGSPDNPQDGLFHTFPSGTILQPGETLWIINQIDSPLGFAQEASEGGVESLGGAPNTNLLTEGNNGPAAESIALVDPDSGDYIVFNMSSNPPQITSVTDFPGTNQVGIVEGHPIFADPDAGRSYQYNADTDSYDFDDAFIPCFATGTKIATADGEALVQDLAIGDLIRTADDGLQPVLWVGATRVAFKGGDSDKHRPVEFKPGSLGPALPAAPLVVSPQHRFLMIDREGDEVLAPAAGLTDRQFVRTKAGAKSVTYYHVVLARHAIIFANGVPTESFYPGDASIAGLPIRHKLALLAHFPQDADMPQKARPFLSVGKTQSARSATLRPAMAVKGWNTSDETDHRATA